MDCTEVYQRRVARMPPSDRPEASRIGAAACARSPARGVPAARPGRTRPPPARLPRARRPAAAAVGSGSAAPAGAGNSPTSKRRLGWRGRTLTARRRAREVGGKHRRAPTAQAELEQCTTTSVPRVIRTGAGVAWRSRRPTASGQRSRTAASSRIAARARARPLMIVVTVRIRSKIAHAAATVPASTAHQ